MPATTALIYNMALGHCGVTKRIQDPVLDTSNEASNCRLFADHVRGLIIEACPWPFITERVELQDLGTPPDGWFYRYKYPATCKRINRIINPATRLISPSSPPIPYAIKKTSDSYGKAIVCDQQNAILEFNEDVDDPALFTSTFSQAYAIGLGAHIAMPLRVDAKIAGPLMNAFNGWLAEAAAQAMREQQDDSEALSSMETGRM